MLRNSLIFLLSLSFLICETRVIIVPDSESYCKNLRAFLRVPGREKALCMLGVLWPGPLLLSWEHFISV